MGAAIEELEPQQVDRLLAEAVERNTAALVEVQDGADWRPYKSRFLCRVDGPAPLLWLELPGPSQAHSRQPVAVSIDGKLIVNFTWAQQRYRFAATVTQTGRPRVTRGAEEGMLITYPTMIQHLQRRANYRCPIPANQRIDTTIWQGGQSARDMAEAGGEPIRPGRLVNISINGLCLQLYGRFNPLLQLGERVGLEFALDGPPLRPDALVRRVTSTASGSIELGLEFVAQDLSAQGRRDLELLAKYVFQMERQSLWRSRVGQTS